MLYTATQYEIFILQAIERASLIQNIYVVPHRHLQKSTFSNKSTTGTISIIYLLIKLELDQINMQVKKPFT